MDLAHVIKYSERPKVCDSDLSVCHYKLSDLLSLSFPRRPVLYSTYMSRTGWGYRPLVDLELASCFDRPEYLPWNDRYLRDIVPLQMFRSVIEAVVDRHDKASGPNTEILGVDMRRLRLHYRPQLTCCGWRKSESGCLGPGPISPTALLSRTMCRSIIGHGIGEFSWSSRVISR